VAVTDFKSASELARGMKNKPTAIGAHIYGGGFTLGMMEHANVLGQWEELGGYGDETTKLNLGDELQHFVLPFDEWPDTYKEGDIEIVFANPPCAPWSNIGGHKGMDDPRTIYADHSIELATRLRPTFFIMESVPQAWGAKGGQELYLKYTDIMHSLGYAVTIWFTNTVLHGIPQHRNRFHFIAHKLELQLPEPQLVNGAPALIKDTIGDLRDNFTWTEDILEGSSPLDLVVPNHNVTRPRQVDLNTMQFLQQREGWKHGYARAVEAGLEAKKNRLIATRLRWDAPSNTMVDIGCVVHPLDDRFLTMREGARLGGYPDWYRVAPTTSDRMYLARRADLTQAVMPCVGSYISKQFSTALDRGKPATPGTLDVVDFRPLARDLSPGRYLRTR